MISRRASSNAPRRGGVTQHVQATLTLERTFARLSAVLAALATPPSGRQGFAVRDDGDLTDLLRALLLLDHAVVTPMARSADPAQGVDLHLPAAHMLLVAHVATPGLDLAGVRVRRDTALARQATTLGWRELALFLFDPSGSITNPRQMEAQFSADSPPRPARLWVRG